MNQPIIDNRVGNPDKDFIPTYMKVGQLHRDLHEHIVYDYELDRRGLKACLNEIARDFNAKNGTNITEANIVLASGARSAASHAIIRVKREYKGIINEPHVLLVKPGYNLYDDQFDELGFELDSVNIKDAAGDDEKLAIIRSALRQETLFIPICNPNNPTGEIYSEYFLKGLLRLIDEFPNLHIINDSIYDRIVRNDGVKVPNIFALASTEQRKKVYDINALSKFFSYPAIRAGWIISDEAWIKNLQPKKDATFGPLNNIAQVLSISAFTKTELLIPDYFHQVNEVYNARLKMVNDKLHQISGFDSEIPGGSFYYWADFKNVSGINAEEIVAAAKERGVLLSGGTKFGAPDCIRINCGAKAAELAIICDRIVEICREKGVEINHLQIRVPALEDDLPRFSKGLLIGR